MPDGINYDAFSEALNDKADRDLQNVDTSSGGDAVIAFQRPTAENNYTWYRKYKSGWVEQGGMVKSGGSVQVFFPVTMANKNYFVSTMAWETSGKYAANCDSLTTTSMNVNNSSSSVTDQCWEVKGMYAQ